MADPQSSAPPQEGAVPDNHSPANKTMSTQSLDPATAVPSPPHSPLPTRLFRAGEYPKNAHINAHSKPQLIRVIADALANSPELDRVRSTPFGKLFTISTPQLYFSGKLVFNFISRHLITAKKNEIWMVFAGKPLKFSLREFWLVTGLECGPYPRESEIEAVNAKKEGKETMCKLLFGDEDADPKIDDLVLVLCDKDTPSIHKLALAFIIIVDGVLTPKSQYVKPSRETMEMLDHFEFFTKFPWGRRSLTSLSEKIECFKDDKSQEELKVSLRKHSKAILGFPLALQLFAFEAIQGLQKLIPNPEDSTLFHDRSIQNLSKIHPISTVHIMALEKESNVSVDSLLYSDHPLPDYSFEFENGITDPEVSELERRIKDGFMFDDSCLLGGDVAYPEVSALHVPIDGDVCTGGVSPTVTAAIARPTRSQARKTKKRKPVEQPQRGTKKARCVDADDDDFVQPPNKEDVPPGKKKQRVKDPEDDVQSQKKKDHAPNDDISDMIKTELRHFYVIQNNHTTKVAEGLKTFLRHEIKNVVAGLKEYVDRRLPRTNETNRRTRTAKSRDTMKSKATTVRTPSIPTRRTTRAGLRSSDPKIPTQGSGMTGNAQVVEEIVDVESSEEEVNPPS
ncbi:hypothetical protein AALP_AA5G153500 [Arabis alpina]|nr:hypothetical protein AALP_AA5G153500 [Arabis alpina]